MEVFYGMTKKQAHVDGQAQKCLSGNWSEEESFAILLFSSKN